MEQFEPTADEFFLSHINADIDGKYSDEGLPIELAALFWSYNNSNNLYSLSWSGLAQIIANDAGSYSFWQPYSAFVIAELLGDGQFLYNKFLSKQFGIIQGQAKSIKEIEKEIVLETLPWFVFDSSHAAWYRPRRRQWFITPPFGDNELIVDITSKPLEYFETLHETYLDLLKKGTDEFLASVETEVIKMSTILPHAKLIVENTDPTQIAQQRSRLHSKGFKISKLSYDLQLRKIDWKYNYLLPVIGFTV